MKKKILFVWPDESYVMFMHTKIPKRWAYFVEIISYLKKNLKNYTIDIIDCLDPWYSNGEILKKVADNDYSCVVMVSRIENIDNTLKLSKWIKNINPDLRILIYGDICGYAPNFFKENAKIDGIIMCGDWELGVISYLRYLNDEIDLKNVKGVEIFENNIWYKFQKGDYLEGSSWSLPDLKDNSFSKKTYFNLTNDEVTISASRGCPFNCKFCAAVSTFGIRDRRKPIEEIVQYLDQNQNNAKSFKFFSPTLTVDSEWTNNLSKGIINAKINISWCGTTRPDCVNDHKMVELMKKSGCYKIAMGIETFDKTSARHLDKYLTDNYEGQVEKAIRLFSERNIKVNALMMVGIKGQTKENLRESYEKLQKWGATIRSAAYSPRDELEKLDKIHSCTLEKISAMDKMTYQNYKIPGLNYGQFLNLIYNTENFREILKDGSK